MNIYLNYDTYNKDIAEAFLAIPGIPFDNFAYVFFDDLSQFVQQV